jgi:hypothetical protein
VQAEPPKDEYRTCYAALMGYEASSSYWRKWVTWLDATIADNETVRLKDGGELSREEMLLEVMRYACAQAMKFTSPVGMMRWLESVFHGCVKDGERPGKEREQRVRGGKSGRDQSALYD